MVGPKRPQIVLFGSSIVQLGFENGGWGSILADVYSRTADIVLRGYCGWNSRRAIEVLDQVFPKDDTIQPSLVIVYFGGNDSIGPHSSGLGPHVPLDEYVENMRRIALYLKSLSDKTRVILLSTPPINEEKIEENMFKKSRPIICKLPRNNELGQKYSDACIDMCKELVGVKGVDLFNAFQKHNDWKNVCFTDGMHFSEEGNKIVVEEILKVLKEAEWKPNLHWTLMEIEFEEDSKYDMVAFDGKTTLNSSKSTFHRHIKWH